MIGQKILHYKVVEKLDEARLLRTCLGESREIVNG